jgi:YidC/Oxa1 family membrane protein insertase
MNILRVCWLAMLLHAPLAFAQESVETNTMRLQFNGQGDLSRAQVCFPDCESTQSNKRLLSADAGLLVFSGKGSPPLQSSRVRELSTTVLTFVDATGDVYRRWEIPDTGWLISLTVKQTASATMQSGSDFRPTPSSGFGNLLEQSRYLVFEDSNVRSIGLDEEEGIELSTASWFGFRNRFWTVMVLPDRALAVAALSGESVEDAQLTMQFEQDVAQTLQLYLGPIEPEALSRSAPELENLMYSGLWFWLRWICQALYYLLGAIQSVIPNWGLAVVLLSVLVGILMKPLSKIADRLQDQVHATDARLSPALTEIKKNYKGAEQSEKIIALYKTENVHPLYSLKSMLGVFVVIPVFIGAFDMLAENIHLSGEPFLWIADLSHTDAFMVLPLSLPFFGSDLNLLPFIMTGFSFIASGLHKHPDMSLMQQRKQSRNLLLMSLGFLVLFYTFPAGMVLYWTTNNLISVIKMLWKRRKMATVPSG